MEKKDAFNVLMLKFNSKCSVIKDGKPVDNPLILGKWYKIVNSVKSHTEAYYNIIDSSSSNWIVKVDLRGNCND